MKSRSLGLLFTGSFLLASPAPAAVLLTVDLSVTNQVTISATTRASAATARGPVRFGIYLENFYGSDGPSGRIGSLSSSGLTPFDSNPSLSRDSTTDRGLNISASTVSHPSGEVHTFSVGTQAFTGAATWTLAPTLYAEMLGGPTGGDIYFPATSAGSLSDPDTVVLGQYQIIPEPGSASLLGLGLGALLLRRRRG